MDRVGSQTVSSVVMASCQLVQIDMERVIQMQNRSLVLLTRFALVSLLGVAFWLPLLTQASFDDDDPTNDPNTCSTDPDPANCDWERGWFQAAVNLGHITAQSAQTRYSDMGRTAWLPEAGRNERDQQLTRYEDDDPTNDPNLCFESTDPNCDWTAGWYGAAGFFAQVTPPEDLPARVTQIIVGYAPKGWLDAIQDEELPVSPGDGDTIFYRGLCPPGTEPIFRRGQPTTCE